MPYGDVHRYLVQTVGSFGVISLDEMRRLLKEYLGNEVDFVTPEYVANLVNETNKVLQPFQQEIKQTDDEMKDIKVLIFLSKADDVISQSQKFFKAVHLKYFTKLLDEIVNSSSKRITSISAEHLVGSIEDKLTWDDASKLLKLWCQMQYLDKDQDHYILGLRTIHEFKEYFQLFRKNPSEECCMCNKRVLRGHKCVKCKKWIHKNCLKIQLENDYKWPCCNFPYCDDHLQCFDSTDSLTQTQKLTTTQTTQRTGMPATQTGDDSLSQDSLDSENPARSIVRKIAAKRKRTK